MIARDIPDEIARLAADHGGDVCASEMLQRMGVAEEELDAVLGAMLDRVAAITEPDDDPLTATGIAWLDGFMVGWSLSRRRIELG